MKREVATPKVGNFRGVCPTNGRNKAVHTAYPRTPGILKFQRIVSRHLFGGRGNARLGVNENRPPEKEI